MARMNPEAREMSKYLRACGIPLNLHTKKLSDFGNTGTFFGELLLDPARMKDYFETSAVVNFYGDSLAADDVMFMILRGLLLYAKACIALPVRRLSAGEPEEIKRYSEQDFLGFWNFYTVGCDSRFTSYQIADIEEFLMDYVRDGGKIIISGAVPIKDFGWYSRRFLEFLEANGRDVEVDAGYRINRKGN